MSYPAITDNAIYRTDYLLVSTNNLIAVDSCPQKTSQLHIRVANVVETLVFKTVVEFLNVKHLKKKKKVNYVR